MEMKTATDSPPPERVLIIADAWKLDKALANAEKAWQRKEGYVPVWRNDVDRATAYANTIKQLYAHHQRKSAEQLRMWAIQHDVWNPKNKHRKECHAIAAIAGVVFTDS